MSVVIRQFIILPWSAFLFMRVTGPPLYYSIAKNMHYMKATLAHLWQPSARQY